ncbi:hypothetical protein [Acinetobacter bouvetii]|uniref:Uncharacterized protein n=1 Tax=Acinetobacter bouvetii TaxID=202951 RepID=A0A811G6M0_9GAMM|nr:hypothetical protein [Acinetobacter bouvetii]CAB1209419.1 hypothetical protein SFB21_0549 [Acinetobacter bouvetii]
MHTRFYFEKLKSFISLCTDEDLVWVLHVFNKNFSDYKFLRITGRDRSYDGLKTDIDSLNSINQLKDIKKLIIKSYEDYDDDEIKYFLYDLEDFKSKIETTKTDLKKVKDNARFLNFACYLMNEKIGNRDLEHFKCKYFNFLYVALTYPEFYRHPRDIERIFSKFSDIHSKHSSHFKNDQGVEFYIWAKKYMDENSAYKSRDYSPTEDSEYPVIVNSIFDQLYFQNPEVHYALRKKLSNAWYQKKFRQDNKVKKANYYALTKKAKESLKALCYKRNLTEDQMIESLINEHYTKECCNKNGDPLYG